MLHLFGQLDVRRTSRTCARWGCEKPYPQANGLCPSCSRKVRNENSRPPSQRKGYVKGSNPVGRPVGSKDSRPRTRTKAKPRNRCGDCGRPQAGRAGLCRWCKLQVSYPVHLFSPGGVPIRESAPVAVKDLDLPPEPTPPHEAP